MLYGLAVDNEGMIFFFEFVTSPIAALIMYSMLIKAELQTFSSSLEVGEFQSL